MHTITYSDARNTLKDVLDRVVNDHDATLIHRREGGNAVVLSEAAYASMMETMHLLSSRANAAHLAKAIAQDKQGKALRRQLLKA